MLRLLNSPDPILSETVKLLDSDDSSFRRLKEIITESSPSRLVATFSFLSAWISSSISQHKVKFDNPKIQRSLALLSLIYSKVPPVILINGSFDLNWGISQPHWALHDFYESINRRIAIIRSYFKPQSAFGQVIPFPFNNNYKDDYWDICMTDLSIDLGVDADYEFALKEHFKKLLLNRVDITLFRPLLKTKNAKQILTQAIIELIELFNSTKKVTHFELMASFTSLFMYVYGFNNDIDAQKLSEYIQTCPYISPECAMAINNNVSQQMLLFNLLIPKEFLLSPQSDIEKLEQYVIYDPLEKDDAISPIFEKVPSVFAKHLLGVQTHVTGKVPSIDYSILENYPMFFEFLHIWPDNLMNKIKKFVNLGKSESFTANHVFCLQIQFLQQLHYVVYYLLYKCYEQHFVQQKTPFLRFLRLIFSVYSPVVDKIPNLSKYFVFNPAAEKCQNASLIIVGLGRYMMNILLNSSNELIVPFCIEVASVAPYPPGEEAKFGDLNANYSHHLIRKLLNSDQPKLGPNVVESLMSSDDMCIVCNYIDALTNPVFVHTFKAMDEKLELRAKLINKMPVEIGSGIPFLVITNYHNSESNSFNNFTNIVVGGTDFNKLTQITCENVQFYIYHQKMADEMYASQVTDFIYARIKEFDDENIKVSESELMLPIAEQCFIRLIFYGHTYLAEMLLERILVGIVTPDSTGIYWISKIAASWRKFLTPKIRSYLLNFVMSTRSFAALQPKINDIFEIAKILAESETDHIVDPNVLLCEFQSKYLLNLTYLQTYFCLVDMPETQIVEMLTSPLYDVSRYWPGRTESCIALAKLAATLSPEIMDLYFRALMEKTPCETSMIAGRVFLAMIRIDSFIGIVSKCESLIGRNDSKLDFFMRMILPSFHRLYGNDNAAVELLCGMMKNVNSKTPRKLQEAVFDTVTLIYVKLGLSKYRARIIASADSFSADIKAIIAGSLDIDFSNTKMKKLFKEIEKTKPSKRTYSHKQRLINV